MTAPLPSTLTPKKPLETNFLPAEEKPKTVPPEVEQRLVKFLYAMAIYKVSEKRVYPPAQPES